MASVLITGTTGLVGDHLYNFLSETTNWNLIGTSRHKSANVDSVIDLTDPGATAFLRKKEDFDIIIHTAALTKTDICERNQQDCYSINVEATKNLVDAFPSAKFVFFSTYAVYNTVEGNCVETDPVYPTNFYISTKIEAEKIVQSLETSIILRPSVIFGYTRFTRQTKNYFMQLLDNVTNDKKMQSPTDQFFNPVYVAVISTIVSKLLKCDRKGIYNIGCNENVSKYEFNRRVMDRFSYKKELLEGIVSGNLQVVRPNNGTISSKKVQTALSYEIPALDEMIEYLYHSVREST